MITASHNPAADNGYKLYTGDGAQIVPPVHVEIEAAIGGLGPLSRDPLLGPWMAHWSLGTATRWRGPTSTPSSPRSPPRRPRWPLPRLPRSPGGGLSSCAPAGNSHVGQRPRAVSMPLRVVYTAMHGVGGTWMERAMERAGFRRLRRGRAGPARRRFPHRRVPQPRGAGRDGPGARARQREGATWCSPTTRTPTGSRSWCPTGRPGGWRMLTGRPGGRAPRPLPAGRTAADPDAGRGWWSPRSCPRRCWRSRRGGRGAATTRCSPGSSGSPAPGGGPRQALRLRLRGGARLRGGPTSCGTRTASARRSPCCRWPPPPARRPVAARPLGRPGGRARRPPDNTGHPARPVPAASLRRLEAAPPAALAGQPVTGVEDLAVRADPRRRGRRGPGNRACRPPMCSSTGCPEPGWSSGPAAPNPSSRPTLRSSKPATPQTLATARMAAAERLGPLRAAVADLVAEG